MIPKVLVLSNECFSYTTSNGRTLGNFFKNWPKDRLAQFFLSGVPEVEFCKNYFQVSDKHALNAVLRKGECGGIVFPDELKKNTVVDIESTVVRDRKISRNAITMLIRELVWKTGSWKCSGYWHWVSNFEPEIILLQAGDCAFMFNLALKTARRFRAKLVIYNTEGYYFKKFDYFKSTGLAHHLYPIFHYILKKSIKKTYNASDFAIFNCEALEKDFCGEFNIASDVIYTATDIQEFETKQPDKNSFIVSYAGNLGVGRATSLVDIANAIHEINPDYYLEVYGTIPNENVQKEFDKCSGLRFYGRVSYEEVKKIIYNSDLLIHTEGFEPYYLEDLKYAFSTKIADCLASNRCFLMYAPKEFAETQYLLQNKIAFVATSNSELKNILQELIKKTEIRTRYCGNAKDIVQLNHNSKNSVAKFQDILCGLKSF